LFENLYGSEVKEQDHKQRTGGERDEGMENAMKGAHIVIKTKKMRKKVKQIAAAEGIRIRKETTKTAQGKILPVIEANAWDEPRVNEGWLAKEGRGTGEKLLEVETTIQGHEGILRQNEDDATRLESHEGETMVLEADKKMRDMAQRLGGLLQIAKEQVNELSELLAEGKYDLEIQETETLSEEGHTENDKSQDAEVGDKILEDDATTLDDKRTEAKAEEEEIDGGMFLIGEGNDMVDG
jgi:hypothetical protein